NSARCYLTTESATTEWEDGGVGPAMSSLHPVPALQQIAQLPQGIRNVRWSTSGGKITSSEYAEVFIDTTAMQKSVIIVTAKFDRDSLICPNEVQTILVVGATQP